MKPTGNGLRIGYIVIAILVAVSMFVSASGKFMLIPGAVHAIHDVVGFPLNLFPLLAICEIAGGLGLLVGIVRPKLGVAAGVGLVLYFVCALIAHVRVGDWAGLKAPIVPFLFSVTVLTLGILRVRRGFVPA
jgi:hypothetical protein